MEKLSYIISDLKYKNYSATRIAKILLNKGFSANEIQTALKENELHSKNKNKIMGVLLIVIGVIANFYTKSTFINNFFRFDFFSQADFMLFNERILKPAITLSMIFLGINLLIAKTRTSKSLKVVLLIFLGTFTLLITSYYSLLAFLFSSISIILIAYIKTPQKIKSPELKKIFSEISNEWNGTVGYVFILLGIVLVYASEINLEYIRKGENSYQASIGFMDYILLYLKPFYAFFGLLASLLLSLDLKKFKVVLYILAGLSVLLISVCLFHSEFQDLIYGCSIILISSIIIYFSNKNRIRETKGLTRN